MSSYAPTAGILPENYRILQESVFSEVGIVLTGDKHYLFEGRLTPVVRQLDLQSINELCDVMHRAENTHIRRMVAEAMTTNETFFFREPVHYEAIKTVLLPKLKEDGRDRRKMSFWSAASSTGQEAYSLAMLLLDEGLRDWNIQILGTDVSSKVLERARTGLFQQIEVNRGLPASLLVKYFQRSGLNWQLSETVRRMARFETIDLRNSMRTLGPFDLVFCRNVLIYFDSETKLKILKEIRGTLFRGGWLLLGGSETVMEADKWYERRTIGKATVYVAR